MKTKEKQYQIWDLEFFNNYLVCLKELYGSELKQNILFSIENEISKIKNYEMMFLVVGTMSSGKSTFLNSLIGEILAPNRETPMTLVPT